MTFFQQHLSQFTTFSRSWGIGNDTFEFWAWMGRQYVVVIVTTVIFHAKSERIPRYRMFAELLELAMQAGLKLDSSLPAYLPMSPTLQSPGGTPVLESVLVSSNTPSAVLQHPGYYYYAAADCSVQRLARFRALSGMTAVSDGTISETKPQKLPASAPGLANEQKVDHTALIIEVSRSSQPEDNRKLNHMVAWRLAIHKGVQSFQAVRRGTSSYEHLHRLPYSPILRRSGA